MNTNKQNCDKTVSTFENFSRFDILQIELNPKYHHRRFPNSLCNLPEAGIMSTGMLKGPHPTTVQADA